MHTVFRRYPPSLAPGFDLVLHAPAAVRNSSSRAAFPPGEHEETERDTSGITPCSLFLPEAIKSEDGSRNSWSREDTSPRASRRLSVFCAFVFFVVRFGWVGARVGGGVPAIFFLALFFFFVVRAVVLASEVLLSFGRFFFCVVSLVAVLVCGWRPIVCWGPIKR